MSVQTFGLEDVITVTPAAAEHFAVQLKKKQHTSIRLSLKKSGCTGFKYVIDEVDACEADDLKVQLANGVVVYVDVKHLAALKGMVVDYTQQGLNKNLVLNNPNVKDACGCGESFSI
ncbi:MAG: iron-sulfur cluster assembly accessory protein [Lentisphaeria bacterium]|jgi:iron-sulfur cluster assembly accessory protein